MPLRGFKIFFLDNYSSLNQDEPVFLTKALFVVDMQIHSSIE